MSNEDNSLDLENEAYVGASPEYMNHADVRDEPMRSENETVSELEQRGIDWARDMVVSRVDVSAAQAVGIVTDVEGNIIDTSEPVNVNFEKAENVDGDPVMSSNQRAGSGPPDFAQYAADAEAARTGATPKASAGASTSSSDSDEDEYTGQTVLELQEELHRRGLPVSGTKAELVERLRADDE